MENRWDAKKAQTERKRLEDQFRANFERLKAERLAREGKGEGLKPEEQATACRV